MTELQRFTKVMIFGDTVYAGQTGVIIASDRDPFLGWLYKVKLCSDKSQVLIWESECRKIESGIPNEFTALETYRGIIITMRSGRYFIFNSNGEHVRDLNGFMYRRDTRAQCRCSIDAMLDQGIVA